MKPVDKLFIFLMAHCIFFVFAFMGLQYAWNIAPRWEIFIWKLSLFSIAFIFEIWLTIYIFKHTKK